MVAAADTRAAGFLIGTILVYGAIMFPLSGVHLSSLLHVLGEYAVIAAYSVVLVGAGYAAVCIVSPIANRRMNERLFWLLVAGLLVWLTIPLFGLFKQLVLPDRGFVWDARLAHLGRALLGVSPWTLTHRWFGSVAGTRLLDTAYNSWMGLMYALPLVAAVTFSDRILRYRILVSWLGAWILLGTVAAWVFASAGPCYYNVFVGHDANYAELLANLARIAKAAAAEGHPINSLYYQPLLLDAYRAREYAPAGGISAMPSMHVAMATLMVIAASKRSGLLAALFGFYWLLIWIGSVHFGWHYFVDGPVATLMMVGVWKLAGIAAQAAFSDERPINCGVPAADS